MIVLGIDSSCDETAAALVRDGRECLSSVVASQEEHWPFGGIVPELASRAHVRDLVPSVRAALERARITPGELDGIAVTCGPGLLGSLLVGVSFAKCLAYSTGVPLIGINHLEGHIWSALAVDRTLLSKPFLALIVSGGHSEIVLVERFGSYRHLGGTRDDAAGEAFDKVAKMLGLGYPGGPAIERLASEVGEQALPLTTQPDGLVFPVARSGPYDFSFSGVKTAVRYHIDRHPPKTDGDRAIIARAFQRAVIEALTSRILHAVDEHPVEHVVLCGGVACNNALCERLESELAARERVLVRPERHFCTDNGAMIGFAGLLHLMAGHRSPMTLGATASLRDMDWSQPARALVDSTASVQMSTTIDLVRSALSARDDPQSESEVAS